MCAFTHDWSNNLVTSGCLHEINSVNRGLKINKLKKSNKILPLCEVIYYIFNSWPRRLWPRPQRLWPRPRRLWPRRLWPRPRRLCPRTSEVVALTTALFSMVWYQHISSNGCRNTNLTEISQPISYMYRFIFIDKVIWSACLFN